MIPREAVVWLLAGAGWGLALSSFIGFVVLLIVLLRRHGHPPAAPHVAPAAPPVQPAAPAGLGMTPEFQRGLREAVAARRAAGKAQAPGPVRVFRLAAPVAEAQRQTPVTIDHVNDPEPEKVTPQPRARPAPPVPPVVPAPSEEDAAQFRLTPAALAKALHGPDVATVLAQVKQTRTARMGFLRVRSSSVGKSNGQLPAGVVVGRPALPPLVRPSLGGVSPVPHAAPAGEVASPPPRRTRRRAAPPPAAPASVLPPPKVPLPAASPAFIEQLEAVLGGRPAPALESVGAAGAEALGKFSLDTRADHWSWLREV